MSARTLQITPPLYEYLMQVGVRESATAAALRVETAKLPMAMMQISPEQAGFMQMIVRLLGVKRALEVGTFTGYSALAVAEAMPSDGKLVACDVSEEWTSIGKRHWTMAGVANKIDLKLGPAVATLDQLHRRGSEQHVRFRVHRRRQEQLRQLLRARAETGARRRTHRHRQHAVERRGGRCDRDRTPTPKPFAR